MKGDWKYNKRNGTGTFTWPNGDVYIGDWKDDKRTGKGKQTWPNGDIYEVSTYVYLIQYDDTFPP